MNFVNSHHELSPSALHPRDNSSLTYEYGSQQTATLFYKQISIPLEKNPTNKCTVYEINVPIQRRSKQPTLGIWVGFLYFYALLMTTLQIISFSMKSHAPFFFFPPRRRTKQLNLVFENPGELQLI